MRSFTSLRALALMGAGMMLAPATAYAQDAEVGTAASEDDGDNAIIVTGSRIRRQSQADLASPLATIGSESISDIGAQNIAEITQTLTINTGAQNNPDAFTQGGTTGTSNINLRGLGVASTLILLNGRRQTLSSAPTNDGINFVDTASLVPLIAVERVEILKALYRKADILILDEPTAALGVKESRRVLELIQDVKSRGIPIILISHNMPHVFEVADRIHIHRLGKRLTVINPGDYTMSDAVAFMTGAKEPERDAA